MRPQLEEEIKKMQEDSQAPLLAGLDGFLASLLSASFLPSFLFHLSQEMMADIVPTMPRDIEFLDGFK